MSQKESKIIKVLTATLEALHKAVGDLQGEKLNTDITKSVDEEHRKAMFVVLVPETADAHGDIYSTDEVEKACANYNRFCMKANLFHRVETEHAIVEQSFISPSDFTLEDGREIKKGTWLMWMYFPETETGDLIWKSVKDGEITGVSVGCRATVKEVE